MLGFKFLTRINKQGREKNRDPIGFAYIYWVEEHLIIIINKVFLHNPHILDWVVKIFNKSKLVTFQSICDNVVGTKKVTCWNCSKKLQYFLLFILSIVITLII